ncbi:hypothetical protein AVEN_165164-1 [Araneus ventricosus]|uniref:Uncharacterized protein n=1 Tax=Araneus ventricosus TaxID=182803 RepID=A0A4Y2B919_ARAVE|nr:hypothetical protein AVEN_165164-1 [Araneus ventricosus]
MHNTTITNDGCKTVDTVLLPIAVLPPLEKRILQSRNLMLISSSSLSEEDAFEYNMSEDLEDSPAVFSPPPSSKPKRVNKYKKRIKWFGKAHPQLHELLDDLPHFNLFSFVAEIGFMKVIYLKSS